MRKIIIYLKEKYYFYFDKHHGKKFCLICEYFHKGYDCQRFDDNHIGEYEHG